MVKRISKRFMAFMLAIVFSTAIVPVMQASAATTIKLGDYVQMGTYYGEPILWRCVDIDENGPLMLSDKIICLKSFDAGVSTNSSTNSHSRNSHRFSYGSNYWADSNMRSWLNSDAGAGNVNWLCGNSPVESQVWNGYNDYADEAGFLTGFTQSELNAVKVVTQKSLVAYPEYENGIYTMGTAGHDYDYNINEMVQNYDTAYAEYVTDKIFLLDVKQINAVYNNSNILGEDYYIGEPTAQCVANSEYTSSSLATEKKCNYWLRSPRTTDDGHVRCVFSDGFVYNINAYYGNQGVRPAFYMNQEVFVPEYGEGTETVPYIIDSRMPASDIDTFSVSVQDGNIVVCNNSSDEAVGIALTAKYDENNNLINTTASELDISGSGQTIIGTVEENYKYKVFIWSDFSKMNPLAMAYMSK